MNDDYLREQREAIQALLINGRQATAEERAAIWKDVRRDAIHDYLGRIEALTDDPVLLERVESVRQALRAVRPDTEEHHHDA